MTHGAAVLVALVLAASASAGNSLRLNATDLGGNVLLVGSYHVANPPNCLAKRPSYGAPNYGQWVSVRCGPYSVQHADFDVVVRYEGREVFRDAFPIDGAYGDPSRGGTFAPYYLYCGLMSNHRVNGRPGEYHWTLTMADPFRRPGYDLVQRGTFSCRKSMKTTQRARPHNGPGLT